MRIVLTATTVAATLLATGCATPDPRSPQAFGIWRANHSASVTAIETYLRTQGLETVLPLHQVLRSASSWQDCQAQPFAVPPEANWQAVGDVLRLLQRLRDDGVLGDVTVHSGYRDGALNSCAGGAARSAHLRSFALDITPLDTPAALAGLCTFWQRHGRDWKMGLGQYPSGRIHVDTMGHRSWGADGTSASSACVAMPAASARMTPGPGKND